MMIIPPPPSTSHDTPPPSPADPTILNLLTCPEIFCHILSFATPSSLAACLRTSRTISHIAAHHLYRHVHLIDIIPSAILSFPHNPSPDPDTRSPFLQYIHALQLPSFILSDPNICSNLIRHMVRLKTVVVPGDWQGWVLHPRYQGNPFAGDGSGDRKKTLKVFITGLRSPMELTSPGFLQTRLLDQADEIVLDIQQFSPIYRGGQKTTIAAIEGKRYGLDIPTTVKRLIIRMSYGPIRAKNARVSRPRPKRAAFDPMIDLSFLPQEHSMNSTVLGDVAIQEQGQDREQEQHQEREREQKRLEEWEDPSPDLSRMISGRPSGCGIKFIIDVTVPESPQSDASACASASASGNVGLDLRMEMMEELKSRTDLLVGGILGEQGQEDGTLGERHWVEWRLAED